MSIKVKRYLGETLVLLFSIVSSFLLLPFLQNILSKKLTLDLDIYNIIMYGLIIILPVVFRLKLLKNSIQHSVLSFWIINSIAMVLQIILFKLGYMKPIFEGSIFFNVIIYIIILSIIQTSITFVYSKSITE